MMIPHLASSDIVPFRGRHPRERRWLRGPVAKETTKKSRRPSSPYRRQISGLLWNYEKYHGFKRFTGGLGFAMGVLFYCQRLLEILERSQGNVTGEMANAGVAGSDRSWRGR